MGFCPHIINDCHLECCHCFLWAQVPLSQGTERSLLFFFSVGSFFLNQISLEPGILTVCFIEPTSVSMVTIFEWLWLLNQTFIPILNVIFDLRDFALVSRSIVDGNVRLCERSMRSCYVISMFTEKGVFLSYGIWHFSSGLSSSCSFKFNLLKNILLEKSRSGVKFRHT